MKGVWDMQIKVRQFSSMEKIIDVNSMKLPAKDFACALAGEHISYQIAISTDEEIVDKHQIMKIDVESPLKEYINIYSVKKVNVDYPHPVCNDTDYITDSPCMLPDVLIPLDNQNGYVNFIDNIAVLWVEVCLPLDFKEGSYSISVRFTEKMGVDIKTDFEYTSVFNVKVLPASLPENDLIVTQWFHVDCIASAHNVSIYSEEHWKLIDKYMAMASELGINMLLTPVFTTPLDTAQGITRPCIQLVDVKKVGNNYQFDFSRLRRYINMAKKNRIKYFEISHFFSQWGCKFSPNIWGEENGDKKYLFGWHIEGRDTKYADFLKNFIPELISVLREENILEKCYFHISDEPSERHLEAYEYAMSLIKPLIDNCKIIDALSDIKFYEKGLIERPVCTNDHIEPFLEKKVPNLWTYYCCTQVEQVSNRFIAMPSYRNRIIGLQMYKYGIEGFLHWGFNFYFSRFSLYRINPYITTSVDGMYPSGDAFSVYPGNDEPLPSLRALVFREALEDIAVCKLLEQKIGKEAVIDFIEKEAGMEITFKTYPKSGEFIDNLMEKMKYMMIEN